MRGDFPVVLDACVLIPMPLADTLLRLASDPKLYLPKWTDQIMAEVSRNLQENFGLTAEQAAYRESEIRKHFGEAWVVRRDCVAEAMVRAPPLAVFAYAIRSGAWRQPGRLSDPEAAGYLRSLVRRMSREANQLTERRAPCLS